MILIRSVLVILSALFLKNSYAKIQPAIVGGDFTTIEQYPHSAHVHVIYREKPDDKFQSHTFCGASILNQLIVLTTAKCTRPNITEEQKQIHIGVGSNNLINSKYYSVSHIKIHEDFNNNVEFINDIALVKLEHALTFGPKVKRIIIMRPTVCYTGTVPKGSLAGWGLIDVFKTDATGNEIYSDMQQNQQVYLKHLTDLELLTSSECVDRFKKKPEVLGDGVFCAQHKVHANHSGYHGDEGGALVVDGHTQLGILSGQLRDAKYKLVANTITDVTFYYDWIVKNTKLLTCDKTESSLTNFTNLI